MKKLKTISTVSALVFATVVFVSANVAQASVQDKKDQWKKERDFHNDTKKELLEERSKIKDATREQIQKNAKEHLIKIIDRLLVRLEKIEKWVNNRNTLSDSQKSEIIAEIQEDKDWLNNKKDKVEDASREEIKEHAKEVKEYWQNNRADIKKIVGEVLASRADFAIEKLEVASIKLDNAIVKAEENGKDVTDAKRLLVEMNSQIDLAKEEVEKAKISFSNITSITNAEKFFKEGRNHILKARDYLKKSHQTAKDIIKDLRIQ